MNSYQLEQELKSTGLAETELSELRPLISRLTTLASLGRSEQFRVGQIRKILTEKPHRSFWPRLIFAPLVTVLVLAVGVGSVLAAQTSSPGSPLYPVKRLSERIAVLLVPAFKEEVIVRRSTEIKDLIEGQRDSSALKEAIEALKEEAKDGVKKSSRVSESIRSLREVATHSASPDRQELEETLKEFDEDEGEVEGENSGSDGQDGEDRRGRD